MKPLGYLILACVVLAIIKAAVMALLVTAALGGIVCLIQQPRETLAIVGVLAATVAFVAHPAVVIAAASVIVVASRLLERSG